MWLRTARWTVLTPLDRQETINRVNSAVSDREQGRQWPFVFGYRSSRGESGFAIDPDWMLRGLYRFGITGTVEDSGRDALLVISLRLGLGIMVEAFLVLSCLVLAVGAFAVIVQDSRGGSHIDFSPLWLCLPLLVMVGIGALARAWLAWRTDRFVHFVEGRVIYPTA